MRRKLSLTAAFLFLFVCVATAFPPSSSTSPPYGDCHSFLIRDSEERPTNGASKVDPATGKVWIAVAKDDLYPMPPYYMGGAMEGLGATLYQLRLDKMLEWMLLLKFRPQAL